MHSLSSSAVISFVCRSDVSSRASEFMSSKSFTVLYRHAHRYWRHQYITVVIVVIIITTIMTTVYILMSKQKYCSVALVQGHY